jgi:hypothetical protein
MDVDVIDAKCLGGYRGRLRFRDGVVGDIGPRKPRRNSQRSSSSSWMSSSYRSPSLCMGGRPGRQRFRESRACSAGAIPAAENRSATCSRLIDEPCATNATIIRENVLASSIFFTLAKEGRAIPSCSW